MNVDNEYIEREAVQETPKTKENKAKREKKSKKTSLLADLMNGEILRKDFVLNNLNFIFFFMLMLLLVVAKGYYGKQLTKDVAQAQKDFDEMTADYIEVKARLEEKTRRNVLVEQLEPEGLKETVNPTKVIRIKTDE